MFISLEKGEKEIKLKYTLYDKIERIEVLIGCKCVGEHEDVPHARVPDKDEDPNVEH